MPSWISVSYDFNYSRVSLSLEITFGNVSWSVIGVGQASGDPRGGQCLCYLTSEEQKMTPYPFPWFHPSYLNSESDILSNVATKRN